jgi:hypothetical protein
LGCFQFHSLECLGGVFMARLKSRTELCALR